MKKKPAGFAESGQAAYSPASPEYERVKLGEAGRLVIPAAMREAMGVKPGDTLMTFVDPDGVLHVQSRRTMLARLQEEAKALKRPGESVVDEFLAERRSMWGEE